MVESRRKLSDIRSSLYGRSLRASESNTARDPSARSVCVFSKGCYSTPASIAIRIYSDLVLS